MSSGYVVAAFAVGLFWVRGAHGIARKKYSPAWDYFAVDEDLNFVVCQACNKKEYRFKPESGDRI